MMGTLDSYDSLLRALANASGAIVAGVDYRLSPEHRYPAALDDSLAAVLEIRPVACRGLHCVVELIQLDLAPAGPGVLAQQLQQSPRIDRAQRRGLGELVCRELSL